MRKHIFTGAGVALITPMHSDGSVNYDELARLLEFQVENGTDAILVLLPEMPDWIRETLEGLTSGDNLFVNFLGALVFSVIGYLDVKSHGGSKLAASFIPRLDHSRDDEPVS